LVPLCTGHASFLNGGHLKLRYNPFHNFGILPYIKKNCWWLGSTEINHAFTNVQAGVTLSNEVKNSFVLSLMLINSFLFYKNRKVQVFRWNDK